MPLRIAVLATNRNPLSEPFAGGQESLTAALVAGFRRRGHHVVLFAADGTSSDLADEVVVYPRLPRISEVAALDPQVPEKPFLDDHHAFTFAVAELARRDRAGELDVVANHSLHHLPMSLSRAFDAPVVTTLHTPPFPWMELGAALAAPTARYVAVSKSLAAQWSTLTAAVVPNGVDTSRFTLGAGDDSGRLAWVGRITPEKAPHLAIAAARQAGRPLVLVGPVSDPEYFAERIEPHLDDGVRHLGALAPEDVADVVGASDGMLVTPTWDEPFGLVAVEAAMCGTPVIALARGGLVETVLPGMGALVGGGAVASGEGLVEADALADDGGKSPSDDSLVDGLVCGIRKLGRFDREHVRQVAVEAFSLDACVEGHLTQLQAAVDAAGVCADAGAVTAELDVVTPPASAPPQAASDAQIQRNVMDGTGSEGAR